MSIGMIAFALAAALVFLGIYWVGWYARRFGRWVKREDAPRERRWVLASAAAVMGFVIGLFAYQPFALGWQCHEARQPIGSCLIQASLAQK